MVPGAGAQVYYNEAGEVLGWDYPSYDPPEVSPETQQHLDAAWESAYEQATDNICGEIGYDCNPEAAMVCEKHEAQIEAAAKELMAEYRAREEW